MKPIQAVPILLSLMFSGGRAIGQIRPPTPPTELAPDIRISGDKSALEKRDAMFIDFTQSIKTDYKSPFLFRPSKAQYHKTEKGIVNLRVDDYDLERIKYVITFNPLATESVTKTFWKTKDNFYFFMFSGGLAVTDRLFGPFRLERDAFFFEGKP